MRANRSAFRCASRSTSNARGAFRFGWIATSALAVQGLAACSSSSASTTSSVPPFVAPDASVANADAKGDVTGVTPVDARAPGSETSTGPDGGSQRDGVAPPKTDGGDAGLTPCVVTPGKSGLLLKGTLLLPAGPTVGELLIASAGTIACAAASCAATTGYAAATVVSCPSAVISPGLINSHDHTEYATRAPEAHGTTRYEHRNDWRTGAEGATALPEVESTTDTATIAAQELRLVMGGGTSVIGSGGVQGLARNLATYPSTANLEGLTGASVYFDTFPLGDSNGTLITSGCAYPSIEKSSGAFTGGRYAPHIAEGINLAAENEITCTTQSSNNLITSKTSVIHGVGTNATDVAKLASVGAYLIWAPRSNISLYGNTAPMTVLKEEKVPIALGTDWLASGSMNMLRELACADTVNQRYFDAAFSDADLVTMATSGGAAAAGYGTEIGALTAGFQADIAVFNGATNQGYRAVLDAGAEDVRLVLRGGKVLYGDTNVTGALATGCDAVSVCGVDRSVCLDTTGITVASLESIGTSIYELFSCRGATPPGEPSCVPYRDTYPNGTSATDHDGDGVPDSADDCPDVFDPVRPLDGTKQSDVDGDGYGDACDAAPTDASSH